LAIIRPLGFSCFPCWSPPRPPPSSTRTTRTKLCLGPFFEAETAATKNNSNNKNNNKSSASSSLVHHDKGLDDDPTDSDPTDSHPTTMSSNHCSEWPHNSSSSSNWRHNGSNSGDDHRTLDPSPSGSSKQTSATPSPTTNRRQQTDSGRIKRPDLVVDQQMDLTTLGIVMSPMPTAIIMISPVPIPTTTTTPPQLLPLPTRTAE